METLCWRLARAMHSTAATAPRAVAAGYTLKFSKGDAMGFRLSLAPALSVLALAGCAANTSQQATAVSHHCAALGDVSGQVAELYASKIVAVKPVHRKDFIARAIQPRYVAGAELYIPGEQGMNEPYLDRMLTCHARGKVAAHPNDPLRVQGIDHVAVDSVGSNYRITVTGRDRAAGKVIWQTARMLEGGTSGVQVQQIAGQMSLEAL